MEIFNNLKINSRVWTSSGYHNHGPMEGPFINIQGNQGGIVSHYESRGYGNDLIVIKWDNGQISKHYANELIAIGQCLDFDEFEKIIGNGRNGKLVLGPLGGFRGFTLEVNYKNNPFSMTLYKDEGGFWSMIKKILESNNIEYITEVLPSAIKLKKGKPQ